VGKRRRGKKGRQKGSRGGVYGTERSDNSDKVARFPTAAGTCRKNAAGGYAYRSRANGIEMSLRIFARAPRRLRRKRERGKRGDERGPRANAKGRKGKSRKKQARAGLERVG